MAKAPAKPAGRKKPKHKPTLVPQAHGGALLSGGTGAYGLSTGRPPDAIRRALRASFEKRLPILEEIADGKDPEAKPSDRIKAVDTLAKYGLGTIQEMSVDSVRGRLARTIELIRSELEPEQAVALLAKMAVLWE
jgi:hypothetical protein